MSFGFLHLAPALQRIPRPHPEVTSISSLNDRFVDLVEEGFDVARAHRRAADASLMARRLAPVRRVDLREPAISGGARRAAAPDDLRRTSACCNSNVARGAASGASSRRRQAVAGRCQGPAQHQQRRRAARRRACTASGSPICRPSSSAPTCRPGRLVGVLDASCAAGSRRSTRSIRIRGICRRRCAPSSIFWPRASDRAPTGTRTKRHREKSRRKAASVGKVRQAVPVRKSGRGRPRRTGLPHGLARDCEQPASRNQT